MARVASPIDPMHVCTHTYYVRIVRWIQILFPSFYDQTYLQVGETKQGKEENCDPRLIGLYLPASRL